MDVIAEYEIKATSTDVTIKVTPTYGGSGSKQNMGYVISGTGTTTTSTDGTSSTTSTDGTYLVVQNMNVSAPYYLNVPLDRSAGYCDPGTDLEDCNTLPNLPSGGSSTKVFKPIAGASNYYLKDPLWYAAKWGGYSGGVAPTTAGGDDPDNYAQVTSPAKLRAAFAKTFENILNRSSTTGAVSASSSQLIADTKLFQSSFNQKYFYGDLNATRFSVTPGTDTNNGTSSYTPAWSAGSAASQLPALVNSGKRRIYYKNKTAGSLKTFEWSNIETDYSTVNLTSDIVSYLRGDQTKETWNTGGKFRSRRTTGTTNGGTTNVDNLLGGLINSAPVYSEDTKTVYVGSNDGMLHAFDSENGSERFAYLPGAVFSNLYRLSDPTFSHRYYVDGQIAVSNKNDTGGINYLVGFMGRGAKGLYGLQVGNASNTTNYPNGVNTTTGAWEFYRNADGNENSQLGYLLGKPLIEKLQDGTDVVIFGNGYNSPNGEATLFMLNLKTGEIIAAFGTSQGRPNNPNGLATPTVTRKNGRVEYVYAGDYHGNVWRFDLSGSRSTYARWNSVARGSTLIKRIFQAKDSSGNRQNITAPLATAVILNNNARVPPNPPTSRLVFFGTGSDLTTAHAANTTQNTMYGLIDTTLGTTDASPINGRANLTQRTIETVTGTYGSYSRNSSVGVRSFSTKVADDMNGKYGWYMDWTKPASGPSERVVSAATVRNAATPTLVVSSNVFASNSCDRTGQGFLNAMDAYSGGGLTESYFDINRNRKHNDEKFTVNGVDKIISSIDFGSGNIGGGGFPDDNVVVQGTEREDDTKTQSNKIRSSRISWREVVK
jgi:type IV pilus assembly protein PilY1